MPLLPPPTLLTRLDTPHAPPATDTRPAESRVQLMLAKTGLLRQQLRDLWGESNPQQANLVQQCLQLEYEVTERLQALRDKLRAVATLDSRRPNAA